MIRRDFFETLALALETPDRLPAKPAADFQIANPCVCFSHLVHN